MADKRLVSLDALLADPTAASEVSLELATALLGSLASLRAVLLSRVEAGSIPVSTAPPFAPAGPQCAPPQAWGPEDLLTVAEAASSLRVSPRWLYRHAKTLPFSRKLSRKALRFSRTGIARWLATKRP